MAVTGAYLSSAGNAFSTRTASQIIQDHFNPQENKQPGGPLFGVQFSQLTCSDLIRQPGDGTVGPKPAPLGLAAEPGGLPLYKNGAVVGGVGVMATGVYSLDLDILDIDTNLNEVIAVAGSRGFDAPDRPPRRSHHGRRPLAALHRQRGDGEQSGDALPAFASINGAAGNRLGQCPRIRRQPDRRRRRIRHAGVGHSARHQSGLRRPRRLRAGRCGQRESLSADEPGPTAC